jgi:hypothetical protein
MKRKVKEVIKENKEEKDSLFNEIKIKSQAAMEYLMTYGWAILIIALTLAVLYSLGIMNPKNFIPRAPPGSCFVFRPNGPGTTDFISLQGTCGYLPMYVGSFNGVNGYVNASPNLKGLSGFTLTGWWYPIKYFSQGSYSGALIKSLAPDAWEFHLGQEYGKVCFILRGNDGNLKYACDSPNSFLYYQKSWHFLTGILNGSSIKLYIDSKLKATVSDSTVSKTLTTTVVGIGHGYITYFNGSIANVQIYSTALTDQEIQYLYQQGLGGGPIRLGSLVGWWPLNGDAKDYSGNNNHGRIYGGVTFVQNYNPP